MQFLPVYLYQNTLDVILDLNPSVLGGNRVMYQHDLKIQKGVKNNVRIQFKNSDQKRIPLTSTQTVVFSMYDAIDQRLLMERQLEILDTGTYLTRGLAQLTLNESDTLDLPNTRYHYSFKMLDTDGSFVPVYSDTYYGVTGTLHLLDDISPVLQPSQEITSFLPSYNSDTNLWEFKSRAIYANPEYNSNTALHTVAVYMTNYTGSLMIQGTLQNDANDLNYYDTVVTQQYTGFTGVDYINFYGILSYINLMYIPALGPTDLNNRDNVSYRGTLDKILYRS